MKSVLVIGMGRFGRHCVEKLNELGHEIMAVDVDEKRLEKVLEYVSSAQIGDGTDEAFMRQLGVSDFDLCVVAIGDDFQSSLETTALLKELRARYIVARANRDVHAKFLKRNGADEVVYPERQLAIWTAIRYSSDNILDYFELEDGYAIFELKMPLSWIGKNIREIDVRRKYHINIIGIKENGVLSMEMNPDLKLMSNQNLLVVGKEREIQRYFHI